MFHDMYKEVLTVKNQNVYLSCNVMYGLYFLPRLYITLSSFPILTENLESAGTDIQG